MEFINGQVENIVSESNRRGGRLSDLRKNCSSRRRSRLQVGPNASHLAGGVCHCQFEIIGVIDDIAFQTRVLALNAMVKVARAGAQGRGFAVVAAEVRTPPERSAVAAKEIKMLISGSVDQVEHGAALVDCAGQAMVNIVNAIHRVADIAREIGAATEEQSSRVGQVGEAFSQMDQVTQQNSALEEQTAEGGKSQRSSQTVGEGGLGVQAV